MDLGFLNNNKREEEQTENEDFVELDAEMSDSEEKVTIRAITLGEFDDAEEVQQALRDDEVVWVNIKPLRNRDMTDLKRAVNRIKKTVRSVDGDMAGVDEEWIVVCPSFAKIERSEEMEEN